MTYYWISTLINIDMFKKDYNITLEGISKPPKKE